MRTFNKGDFVHNICEGTPMEVVGFVAEYYLPESKDEGVLCRWQDGIILFERVYPPSALEIVDPVFLGAPQMYRHLEHPC